MLSIKTLRNVLTAVMFTLLLWECVRSSYKTLKVLPEVSLGSDEVSLSERRFDQLLPFLPARGHVCFLDRDTGSPEESAHYIQAQYALSPRIILRGTDCRLLIVNVEGEISNIPPEDRSAFMLVHDYGRGLSLWAKLDKGPK